jgi:hypothetical protein
MAATRSFKELVQARVARDPEFATALLRADAMLSGDPAKASCAITSRRVLRSSVGRWARSPRV